MSDTQVLQIVIDMVTIGTKLSAPILLMTLVVGVFVSVLQTITQIQEMTLTFVPKLVGVALLLVFGGGWMVSELVTYVVNLWSSIPSLI